MVTCQKLHIPTEFATNLVQGEGASTQGGWQPHREGTSTAQPPPSRSAHSQSGHWKKIMQKLLCLEAKIDANTTRLRRSERHLGIEVPPSPEAHQEEDEDGGEE